RCQFENPVGAKYCLDCGARQPTVACRSCGTELPASARFCLACGRPVEATAAEPSADPTPVAAATEPVTRLVAPEAYTPRRLAEPLRPSLEGGAEPGEGGVILSVRMGINTGHVVVGKIGDNLRMDYTAIGDATNLAARLQQIAEPGTILVSEATNRLVQGDARLEALSPVQVKGKAEPVTPFRLLGVDPVRSVLGTAAAGRLGPFVGRAAELAALRARLGALEGGHGHVVDVVGEAVMGKSRLLVEFCQELGEGGPVVLAARSLSP